MSVALFLSGLLEELPLGASRGKRKKVSRVKTSKTQVPGEVATLQKDACVGCNIVWALGRWCSWDMSAVWL